MRTPFIITIALAVWLFGCSDKQEQSNLSKTAPQVAEAAGNDESIKAPSSVAVDTASTGVLMVLDAAPDSQLVIHNADGSIWRRFFLTQESQPKQFRPFRNVYLESLEMRVVGRDESHYEVIVHEPSGLTKYVRKTSNLVYIPWKDYLLDTIIGVPQGQVLRVSPQEEAKGMSAQEEVYQPIRVQGQWLKVGAFPDAVFPDTGWIKWRTKDDSLLVNFRR